MNRHSSGGKNKPSTSVSHHLDWLGKDLEELLDAEFLELSKMPINHKELVRLRERIDDIKGIINRYRLLGLI